MTKTVFVISYLALGGVSLFYGGITDEMATLGVPDAAVTIIGDFIDATIKTVGAIAVAVLGLSLPTLPGKTEEK